LPVNTPARLNLITRFSRWVGATVSGALLDLWRPPASQIPFLDGLRTIAVLLVVNNHLNEQFVAANGTNFYSRIPFVVNGWIGVDLFFVLSGFFIGGQLWKELQRSGRIEIRRFVLRRGFRIWPLFYFVFFCIFVLTWPHAAAKQYGWSDVVFLTNYLNHGIVLGSWSLCTEEQFYILAPVLLALFATRKIRNYRPWLWIILALPLLNRIAVWVYETGHFFEISPVVFANIYYKFNTHCDGLIMGMIISNVWVSSGKDQAPRRKNWAAVSVLAGFGILVLAQRVQHQVLIFTGLAFFFGSLVWFGLHWNVSFFNSRLFYWGSRLSYGMYLNHAYLVPWVNNRVLPHVPMAPIPRQITGFILLSVLSALLAVVTFCLVEHPFLELRGRWLAGEKDRVRMAVETSAV